MMNIHPPHTPPLKGGGKKERPPKGEGEKRSAPQRGKRSIVRGGGIL